MYFCDTGMARLLGDVSEGQLFENSVNNNLIGSLAGCADFKSRLSYYMNSRGKEIDFILNNEIALEVKDTASARDIEYTRRRAEAVRINEYYVISRHFSENERVIMAWDLPHCLNAKLASF